MAVRVSANWTEADGLSTNRVVLLAVDHEMVISTSSSETCLAWTPQTQQKQGEVLNRPKPVGPLGAGHDKKGHRGLLKVVLVTDTTFGGVARDGYTKQ